MDFAYTTEHEMVQKTVRDFAEKEIRPVIAEFDREQGTDAGKRLAVGTPRKAGLVAFVGRGDP